MLARKFCVSGKGRWVGSIYGVLPSLLSYCNLKLKLYPTPLSTNEGMQHVTCDFFSWVSDGSNNNEVDLFFFLLVVYRPIWPKHFRIYLLIKLNQIKFVALTLALVMLVSRPSLHRSKARTHCG